MPRTSETITQQEAATYQAWCKANLVILSGNKYISNNVNASNQNANIVADYFMKTWNVDINKTNLDAALTVLRPQLRFWTRIQQEFDQACLNLSEPDHAVLADWFDHQSILVNEGDQGLTNLVVMLDTLKTRGRGITKENLNLMLNNGYFAHQRREVFFKRQLQDYEIENLRRKKETEEAINIGISPVDRTAEHEEQKRKQRLYELSLGLNPQG
jgi:hypothetical protein